LETSRYVGWYRHFNITFSGEGISDTSPDGSAMALFSSNPNKTGIGRNVTPRTPSMEPGFRERLVKHVAGDTRFKP
jgi:hypothetical protein